MSNRAGRVFQLLVYPGYKYKLSFPGLGQKQINKLQQHLKVKKLETRQYGINAYICNSRV